MSDFEINIPGIQTDWSELIGVGRKMLFARAKMENVKNNLRGSISQPGYAEIQKSLVSASKSISNQIEHIQKLSVGLKQISDIYVKNEQAILDSMGVEEKHAVYGKVLPGVIWKVDGLHNRIQNGAAGATTFFGIPVSGAIGGGLFGYEKKGKTTFGVKKKDGKLDSIGAFAEGSVSGHVAEGHGSVKVGISETKGSAKFLTGGVTGAIGLALVKDGKFTPQAVAKAKAEVAAASAKVENKIGNDEYNFHTEAKGKALAAEAKAEAGIGVISMTDENGNEYSTIGAQADVGAEAYVAKGEISQGFTIMGIKFDVGAEGKAISAGAHAGVKVNTGGIKGDIGASLGLGLGLNFSIDWTGFRPPWK